MFSKIQFLEDTSTADCGEIPPDTFLIFRDGYNLPSFKNVEYIDFMEFKNKYFGIHANKYIFVGLNRIITPQNRCDMVFDYMTSMTRNIEKISIDTQPFIGEPWRVCFHYDITNQECFNAPYSYVLETEWKHWFYRTINDCKLSAKNIMNFIKNADSYSTVPHFKTSFAFYDNDDESWYQEAKEHVLSIHYTGKMILNNLLKLCNKRYDLKISWDSYRTDEDFKIPDNKLYRFVVEENIRRLRIYNSIIGFKNELR